MELDEIWLSEEEYQRSVEYLLYSFDQIDDDLFESFVYAPLREENLELKSMFYADICLRVYPVLTIGFNVLSFGNDMKNQVAVWKTQKEKGESPEYYRDLKLDKIIEGLIKLKQKNLENKDKIRDYFKFFNTKELSIEMFFNIEDGVEPLGHLGHIEYNKKIQPFEKKAFNKWLDTRNAIEHRGKVEASMREACLSISALYLVILRLAPSKLDSLIFGEPFQSIPTYLYR